MRFVPLLVLVGVPILTCLACASKDGAPQNNGVNDVKKSCEIRQTWANRGAERCVNCIAAAPSPPCGCELFKDFEALCRDQGAARLGEPGCTADIDTCVRNCSSERDCTCIDNCYFQNAACRRAEAAQDGCVTEACTKYCQ